MFLDSWVIDLLNNIQTAAEKGENYELQLDPADVAIIADAYKHTEWIEIY